MIVGLPLSDHIVCQVICQHPSLYIRTVQGQMYCIMTKYMVVDHFRRELPTHEDRAHQMLMRVNIRCHTCISFSQSVLVFY